MSGAFVPSNIEDYILYASINWEGIFNIARKIQPTIHIAIIISAIAVIIGIANLWNQRKIKKQLRQLLEEREKEDKPNN